MNYAICDLIRLGEEHLRSKNIQAPKRQAEELLAFILNKKRSDLYLVDLILQDEAINRYIKLIQCRGRGEPLTYLIGEIDFASCSLAISSSVLIPRNETEILLTLALKEIDQSPKILWDLCSGSGCLGLGAKKNRPSLDVTLIDISAFALMCSAYNAKRNHLQVNIVQSDLLACLEGKKADYILCNPPYIAENKWESLEKEVKLFEPKCALVGGATGIEYFIRLSETLPLHLNQGAKVFLEIGHTQKEDLMDLFSSNCWKTKRCLKDWAKHDRFFLLEFSN